MLFNNLIILVLLTLLIVLISFLFLRMVRIGRSRTKNSSNVVGSRENDALPVLILSLYFFFNVATSIWSGLLDLETQRIAHKRFIVALWLGWVLLLIRVKITSFLAQQLSQSTNMDYKKLLHLIRSFYLLMVVAIIALGLYASFDLWT